jgi:hypothetical protein
MNQNRCDRLLLIFTLFAFCAPSVMSQADSFDYKRYLLGSPPTLWLWIQSMDPGTGSVTINGVDTQGPTTPFTWKWGDGNVTTGFFPQSHVYPGTAGNYMLRVIAHYAGGTHDSTEILIRFSPPVITPVTLPPAITVRIPSTGVTLATRLYSPPSLAAFGDSWFTSISRSTLEYILSVASFIQKDFTNDDVFLFNSNFEQVMLRDSAFGGAYSLWFTNPVAFGVGDVFLQGTIGYSSLFHEMGHNYTLNSPGNHYFGGRIDGNANAIFSESMAQIYQHAAGYEIVNRYQEFGLSVDLMEDIRQSLISSIGVVRTSYEDYISSGKPYTSWNDPATPTDEAFGSFMTIAYKFCEQAELSGQGYRTPLKRMMKLLQGFNTLWAQRYDQSHNTAAADTFRATLMVTALSFGFAKDLRADFRGLNFPISDVVFEELYASVTPQVCRDVTVAPGWNLVSIPAQATDSAVTACYPGASSQAFAYATGYFPVSSLGTGKGYWLKFPAATSFAICGTATFPKEIPVATGWNIVSPYEMDVATNTIITTPADIISSSFFGYNSGYSTVTTLQSNRGYWVKVSKSGVLCIPGGVPKTSDSRPGVDPSWVRVQMTDATGQSGSLFLASTDDMPRYAELPPIPPAGIFDVRYASNRYVDALGVRHEIEMTSAVYPVALQVLNLKGVNLALTDAATGMVVQEQLEEGKTYMLARCTGALILEDGLDMPTTYELSQNYPNPFNPSTVVSCQLPVASSLRVVVYNLLGQEVEVLANEEKPAGRHNLQFDASKLATGVYVCRMTAGPFTAVRKMVLMR